MPKRQRPTHTRAAATSPVLDTIRQLLATHDRITAGAVAAASGVTRQAAQYHLRRLAASGEINRRGAGRSAHYVRAADYAHRWPIGTAEEDQVWGQIMSAVACVRDLRSNVASILRYALTEMVNNAIDHSRGAWFEVVLWCGPDHLAFAVVDDGVGAFRTVRKKFDLDDEFAAIGHLAKGKQTAAPERHSGEGIFFTSKAVDRFELEANSLRWIVDSRDQAIGDSSRRAGTRVRVELDPLTDRALSDVFEEYLDADTLEFDRTSVTVRLFERGDAFVSRSEAKRLAARLEEFREVVLDFEGVSEIGQGFVDELFRVWATEHPDVELVPVNMGPAVERMVRRGSSTR